VANEEPIMAGMAGRYAAALLDLAKEQGALAEVEGNLLNFQKLLDESEDLRRLVRSPVFSAEDQGRALSAVLDKAGIGGLSANFLKLLARNRRLFAVGDMIRSFKALCARERGEVPAEVTSAVPLDDAQVSALREQLKASVGKDVQLTTRVDPALLGGLVVKLGSRMIDSSLKTKLTGLRIALKA